MEWTLPGTCIGCDCEDWPRVEDKFNALFLAGDIQLGQVARVSGLEPYCIQNWVKRGYLSPPRAKRYSLNQLCRILNINMLRGAMPIEAVCGLLSYINGRLEDESDDIITDTSLYYLFLHLAAAIILQPQTDRMTAVADVVNSVPESVPGTRRRIAQVLDVMLSAWMATRYRQETEALLRNLQIV